MKRMTAPQPGIPRDRTKNRTRFTRPTLQGQTEVSTSKNHDSMGRLVEAQELIRTLDYKRQLISEQTVVRNWLYFKSVNQTRMFTLSEWEYKHDKLSYVHVICRTFKESGELDRAFFERKDSSGELKFVYALDLDGINFETKLFLNGVLKNSWNGRSDMPDWAIRYQHLWRDYAAE